MSGGRVEHSVLIEIQTNIVDDFSSHGPVEALVLLFVVGSKRYDLVIACSSVDVCHVDKPIIITRLKYKQL